jgi:hypothetical protein
MASENVQKISKIIKKHRDRLVVRNRVKQLGIGYKVTGGKITETVGIVAFVTKKLTDEALRNMQVEPVAKEIDGVSTDIIEIPGGFKPRAPDDARYRPFPGGVAMINYRTPATGTLGLVLKIRGMNSKRLYALTNNHVGANEDVKGLVPPAAKKGDYWIQPGAHGGGTVPADVIAKLYQWNRIKPSAPGAVNYYDAAVGEIIKSELANAKPYEIMDIGSVKGIEDINLGDTVMKRGRTTLKTIGRVVAVMQSVTVEYRGYPCDFDDQVLIVGEPVANPFSQPGDSGSVVVSADKDPKTDAYNAKALLFAGGTSTDNIDFTVASPIRRIARDFGLLI